MEENMIHFFATLYMLYQFRDINSYELYHKHLAP